MLQGPQRIRFPTVLLWQGLGSSEFFLSAAALMRLYSLLLLFRSLSHAPWQGQVACCYPEYTLWDS